MKDEEVMELEALRAELGRYYRESRAVELECSALIAGPATPESRARAQRIQEEFTAREARFQRIADMVMGLLARPYDDARLAAEGLPS